MRGRVGIVGAGIGGLTAAIALRLRGFDVRVFERAEHRTQQGIALLVWANAVRALASIGVDLSGCSAPIERTEVRAASGELLTALPIDEWSAKAGARSVAIRRPVLVDVLASALPDGLVERGRSVTGFVRSGASVSLRFASGEAIAFDAVIGADGLGSVVRTQLRGRTPLRIVPQRAWVGLSKPPEGAVARGVTTATLGHGPRFWVAPLPDGAAFWFATLNRSDAPDGNPLAFLREGLARWHAPIDAVLAATREEDVVTARLCDRVPDDRWGEGPVTLLGDAAHASTPDLGQGACQAIESATTLAECLAASDGAEAGLRAYERARMEHTATISRLCRITSLNTTMENPLLCALRDAGIKVGLQTIARQHFRWILGSAA